MSRLHSSLPLPHFVSPMCVCMKHDYVCTHFCMWVYVSMSFGAHAGQRMASSGGPHLTLFESGSQPLATVNTSTAGLCPSGILLWGRVSAIGYYEQQHWPLAFRESPFSAFGLYIATQGYQMLANTSSWFFTWDANCSSHACVVHTLLGEPSPQTPFLFSKLSHDTCKSIQVKVFNQRLSRKLFCKFLLFIIIDSEKSKPWQPSPACRMRWCSDHREHSAGPYSSPRQPRLCPSSPWLLSLSLTDQQLCIQEQESLTMVTMEDNY